MKHFLPFIICVCLFSITTIAAVWDDLPVQKDLPDPLRMEDGRHVKTVADWKERRKEILELVLRYEYGHVPPSPGNVEMDKVLVEEVRNEGLTRYRQVRLKMGTEQKLTVTLHIYFPSKLKVPRPVVLRIGLGDEAVRATNERGYIFACFDNSELDPDIEGHGVIGPAQKLYPVYDWGSLAVWAWGASRALDYLITLPEVDADKVVITGHSRCGKTALLAGALDERRLAFAFNICLCFSDHAVTKTVTHSHLFVSLRPHLLWRLILGDVDANVVNARFGSFTACSSVGLVVVLI